MERLPVGKNRSGISTERGQGEETSGEEEGKRLSDNSEEQQTEQRDAGR